ncbi:TetR/AcrR family transcriptional regulator [Marinirhabdus gelatinilytica]|uniref:TetR family transcriptional regulator n=1 Tax=Marinirhabdus gelatinilytica TaxID=1703343 RepID=A0A370QJW9_9FLAO|nr:TetR/AcrR family transcriptional regulator [Marinirhabdus gelatinilytica]RDK88654.1 TetR family transcriptional regulator [Marinirhabdus gelatinilytica]
MRNAETTKQLILKESANLFNTQGYKATSISDITKATGLTKGAIYRHFESKGHLEKQALRSLGKLMFTELGEKIKLAPNFQSKMEATFAFFEEYMHTPLYKGGCPLMNAAVEADDTNSPLRQQTYNMLAQLKASLQKITENGIKNGQVRPETDSVFYATIFIATLEGGIMMSKLERNDDAITKTIQHLKKLVEEISI